MGIETLLKSLEAVKNTVRTGWMLRGIPASIGETVASHSFEASVLAFYLASKLRDKGVDVDVNKASVLAVFHDLPEAITGDIVKYVKDAIVKARDFEEKVSTEAFGDEIANLIREFNELKTSEAKIARLAEILATHVQGKRYLANGYSRVEDIVNNTLDEINRLIKEEPLSKIADVVNEIVSKLRETYG